MGDPRPEAAGQHPDAEPPATVDLYWPVDGGGPVGADDRCCDQCYSGPYRFVLDEPVTAVTAGADRVLPGSRWRTLAHTDDGAPIADSSDRHPPSVFDELVVSDWFHLEQMDVNAWWMSIGKADGGNVTINVIVGDDGLVADVLLENDV